MLNANLRKRVKDSGTWIVPDWALFALGVTSSIKVESIGILYGLDFVVVASFPFVIRPFMRFVRVAAVKQLFSLSLLWLGAAIFSDIVNSTPFADMVRGIPKVIMLLATIIVVVTSTKLDVRRVIIFICGLQVADIGLIALAADAYQKFDPWKFGLGSAVATLVATAVNFHPILRARRSLIRPLALCSVGVLSLFLGSRNLFGTASGAAVITLVSDISAKVLAGRKMSRSFAIALLLFAAAAGSLIPRIYGEAAKAGVLGPAARNKFYQETAGSGGLLLGGRSESLASTQAISDSPIIGHGSWARDPERKYEKLMLAKQEENGQDVHTAINLLGSVNDSDVIPSHSYLLGAWVEHGIAGAVFWAFVVYLAARATIIEVELGSLDVLVTSFLFLELIWNIAFSPFGSNVRFIAAGQICLALSVLIKVVKLPKLKAGRAAVRSFGERPGYGT